METVTKSVLDDYIKPDDLARDLDVTRRTLERWHALGEGPARVKVGSKIFYRASAVHAWMKENEQTVAA